MFSKTELAKKYIHYLLTASNGKGHGIHSPFVFDFVTKLLNDKKKYPAYAEIEQMRSMLKSDKNILTIEDFGAGSRTSATKKRSVSSIASTALKPRKYAQLMYRMVQYFPVGNIVELGTSLGVTTSYLAKARPEARVTTFEGAPAVAAVAKKNFTQLALNNITQKLGNFDLTLPEYLQSVQEKNEKLDFIFIDGNHREDPTIQYFKELLPYAHNDTVMIFDDIHWSEGMEKAWQYIQSDSAVTLTIDLFFIGIVFFRKEQKEPEHFQIRF